MAWQIKFLGIIDERRTLQRNHYRHFFVLLEFNIGIHPSLVIISTIWGHAEEIGEFRARLAIGQEAGKMVNDYDFNISALQVTSIKHPGTMQTSDSYKQTTPWTSCSRIRANAKFINIRHSSPIPPMELFLPGRRNPILETSQVDLIIALEF